MVSLLAATLLLAAPDDAQREADVHFNRGVSLDAAGKELGALDEFKEAYRLVPAWQVLFNLAVVNEKLARSADAIAAFEAYLAQGGASVPRDKRLVVEQQVAQLHKQVGEITIHVDGEPVELALDGAARGSSLAAERFYVMPGRHQIVGRRGDSVASATQVDVGAGERVVVSLVFAAPAPPVAARPPAQSPPPQLVPRAPVDEAPLAPILADSTAPELTTPWYRRWYVWTAVAAVAAGTATAIVIAETRPHYDVRLDAP